MVVVVAARRACISFPPSFVREHTKNHKLMFNAALFIKNQKQRIKYDCLHYYFFFREERNIQISYATGRHGQNALSLSLSFSLFLPLSRSRCHRPTLATRSEYGSHSKMKWIKGICDDNKWVRAVHYIYLHLSGASLFHFGFCFSLFFFIFSVRSTAVIGIALELKSGLVSSF